MYNSETHNTIDQLRLKIKEGTATIPEMQEAVRLLREGRVAAQARPKAAGKKKAAAAVDIDALEKELQGL